VVVVVNLVFSAFLPDLPFRLEFQSGSFAAAVQKGLWPYNRLYRAASVSAALRRHQRASIDRRAERCTAAACRSCRPFAAVDSDVLMS